MDEQAYDQLISGRVQPLNHHMPLRSESRPARLTVVESVYYQPSDAGPTGIDHRYSRNLATDEQLYQRRLKVGRQLLELDFGWIQRPSMVVLANRPVKPVANLSPEEREPCDQTIEVMILPGVAPALLIAAGESCRFQPGAEVKLRLRCRQGETRCDLYVLPE